MLPRGSVTSLPVKPVHPAASPSQEHCMRKESSFSSDVIADAKAQELHDTVDGASRRGSATNLKDRVASRLVPPQKRALHALFLRLPADALWLAR